MVVGGAIDVESWSPKHHHRIITSDDRPTEWTYDTTRQDNDSSVREAACEALALVARGIAEAGGGTPASTASSPIVKVILDCMSDGKKELQASACSALGMVRRLWGRCLSGVMDAPGSGVPPRTPPMPTRPCLEIWRGGQACIILIIPSSAGCSVHRLSGGRFHQGPGQEAQRPCLPGLSCFASGFGLGRSQHREPDRTHQGSLGSCRIPTASTSADRRMPRE